jgi:hypothetical protein
MAPGTSISKPFTLDVQPDGEELLRCIRREGTPSRVHFIELFLDPEVETAICECYGVAAHLDPADPFFAEKRMIALQRFLGYDHVRAWPEGIDYTFRMLNAPDTAGLPRAAGRDYVDDKRGIV